VVEGLTIGRRDGGQEMVRKTSTTLELLARHGALEVTRQRIAAGKLFYLDAASEWEGFEFFYLLAGRLLLKDSGDAVSLGPGDFFHHGGLPQRIHFRVEEDVEFLMFASPPSFHLMRDEIQEFMALATSVEEKDESTAGHCHRLQRWALLIGERLGLPDSQLATVSYAAYLHDIGKVEVSDEILNKAGPLTDEERAEMEQHPLHGEKMLDGKVFLSDAARIVGAHHERYDGSGYPRGLKGDTIPIEARIVAVVDAYDAMTSQRPYRKALTEAQAREELRKYAGTQFDPRVVRAFLAILERGRAL
jgi:HD-GYP domain-containing protein (c-di-GMP phosphodiesterase class II)